MMNYVSHEIPCKQKEIIRFKVPADTNCMQQINIPLQDGRSNENGAFDCKRWWSRAPRDELVCDCINACTPHSAEETRLRRISLRLALCSLPN